MFRRKRSPRYAYCETVSAGPDTPWHVRQLTDAGMKRSGGADTPALCGREVAWDTIEVDLERVVRNHRRPTGTLRVCAKCGDAAEQAG